MTSLVHALPDLVVKSLAMSQAVQIAAKVAGVDSSVLLLGEFGVGKVMLARIISPTGLPGELRKPAQVVVDPYVDRLTLKEAVALAETRMITAAVQRWGGAGLSARA
jgi:hypothetical protein